MNLLDSLNNWTEVLLGIGIIDCWRQASQTKAAAQKAEKLARDNQLREAARIVEKTLAAWSSQPRFWERLIRHWLLGNLLKQLKQQLQQWHNQISEADKLATQAKALLKQDTGNPLESKTLSQAIALYERCTTIVYDEKVLRAISQCKQELQRRQKFQKLVTEAEAQAEKRFFKLALPRFREAEQLYSTEPVRRAIANCSAQIKHEDSFSDAMKVVQQAFREGRLRGAITLLESALTNFPRSDGIELLEQLKRIVKGKEKFRQGLNAEQLGAFKGAASMYEEAKVLLLDSIDCQIRLGQVAIKTKEWANALSHLEGVRGNQAAYLRGFAQAQQGNLQQAHREWQSLTQAAVESQRELLKSLAQRQRLLSIRDIEQLVKAGSLEKAKTAGAAFVQKFGSDPLVQSNLEEHIQPLIETTVWQGTNWVTIADTVEKDWIERPNFTTLHNWAVATYYCVQGDPTKLTKLTDLIFALSTALANLYYDPALQDIPWLGTTPVDFERVFLDLQQRVEKEIDTFKDSNTHKYLQLRDRYRLEVVALRLMGTPPKQGMKIKQVFVTPGCHQRFQRQWQKTYLDTIDPKQNLLHSLYTSWALAVAACVEGDTQRAIEIKPSTQLSKQSPAGEVFAFRFVSYHEGRYYLQQQKWRKAVASLKQSQAEIKASTDWRQELDNLCATQRQVISEVAEHLEFAQFWYDLLGSQAARSYLTEYKAEQIREKLAKEQISFSQASQELQELKRIDEKNPVVIDLIDRIDFSKEMKEIQELMQRDRFEDAVRRAKSSKHERVRFIVAEICINILLEGAEARQLSSEAISRLGQWAYELCPNEPAFREIYRQLGLRY